MFVILFGLVLCISMTLLEFAQALEIKESDFKLHILKNDWKQLKWSHIENCWTLLKGVDLSSESEFVITASDIESYNWPDQSITINSNISTRLLKKYFTKDLSKQHSWSMVERALQLTTFLVTLRGEKLYCGVFFHQNTAIGISFPVIYPQIAAIVNLEPVKIEIRLVIRPIASNGFYALFGYKKLDSSIKRRIEIKKIHDFFKKLGKLTDIDDPHRVEPWVPRIEPVLKLKK